MLEPTLAEPAAGLLFLLGMRHGIDPDHIAVVDNLAFLAAERRPRQAPWTGSLFAIGHSLSVGIVALVVAALANTVPMPAWLGSVIDTLVIVLLVSVGLANLASLLAPTREDAGPWRPVGWRSRLLPRALQSTCHPLAVIGIGMIMGAVFDTATQAAAWGAAAGAGGGIGATLRIIGLFAAGMMTTDTLDSQIVARLLRDTENGRRIAAYRRGIGWLIVALSFGMAGYALAETLGATGAMADSSFMALGLGMMALVTGALAVGRWRMRRA